ncbi:Crp/Fnr family transcriptional regulator [Marinoscillum furvescens]|uniref:CRP/FNR family transcriptional regulator n=1 Tax=Marinoscillum furvescens DSM 4134 TaxID=1122208 RepID=A0A3D9L1E8_MARFU|nr:Crp/Fnr family transcriptional regulator [Marinoscillum furvescens]RED97419.1 CRP/FNR family transcriptional regulator [Marinoscillum furvescens DSM 4134]
MDNLEEILEGNGFEKELVAEIKNIGRSKRVSSGGVVVSADLGSEEIPLVLSGLLKLLRKDDQGNELFLYHLQSGETCAMSITCCLEGKTQDITVVAEEDSQLWMIPMHTVDRWIQRYKSFRKFVFRSYQERFDELLGALDGIAFLKMDERLMKYLLDLKQASGSFVIKKTHQEIAKELNTSRVVVSRLLKQLERDDKIEQHRNRIEIL